MLSDSDWLVRRSAVMTLGKVRPDALVQHSAALVAKLEDSYIDVRWAAVKMLGKLPAVRGNVDAVHTAIVTRLRTDSDSGVRHEAWQTLRKLGFGVQRQK